MNSTEKRIVEYFQKYLNILESDEDKLALLDKLNEDYDDLHYALLKTQEDLKLTLEKISRNHVPGDYSWQSSDMFC